MARTQATGITKWSSRTQQPRPASAEVHALQVEGYSERAFAQDLAKATQRKPKSS